MMLLQTKRVDDTRAGQIIKFPLAAEPTSAFLPLYAVSTNPSHVRRFGSSAFSTDDYVELQSVEVYLAACN